ncbi:hypothetical protein Tco_0226148, partial [Tanacetum coccineum]
NDEEVPNARVEMDTEQTPKTKRKHKKPDAYPEPSNSESSSTLSAYKGLDNYIPTTKRVMAKTLHGFNEFLHAYIADDLSVKHEEDAACYADLKAEIEGFHDQQDHSQQFTTILNSLGSVLEALKDDPALNCKVLEAIDVFIKKSFDLSELKTHMQ